MNIEEVIEQLENLQMHCKDFVDKEDDCIWERDVQALGKAIELLEKEIPIEKEPTSQPAK